MRFIKSVLTLLRSRSFPDRRAREAALAKVLGLLHEAAAHASARLAAAAGAAADAATLRGSAEADPPLTPRRPPPRCQLLVSDRGGADGEGPPLLFVYQRWLPLILAVRTRGDGGGGGGGAAGGTCALQVLPTDDGPQDPTGAQHAELCCFSQPAADALRTGTVVRYSLGSSSLVLEGVESHG